LRGDKWKFNLVPHFPLFFAYGNQAANFMFGFNANIILNINDFYEFNSLRKNQLLRFYAEVEPIIGDCMDAIQKAKGATKYRDYCKF